MGEILRNSIIHPCLFAQKCVSIVCQSTNVVNVMNVSIVIIVRDVSMVML